MDTLPPQFSKSMTNLRSFLDAYSISSHKPNGSNAHGNDHVANDDDESYDNDDEEDCYTSNASRRRNIQIRTASNDGSTTLSTLTLSETTMTSASSPPNTIQNFEEEMTPHSLIRILSGSVSSMIPSPFFSCDPYTSTIPELLPHNRSEEWIDPSKINPVPAFLEIKKLIHSNKAEFLDIKDSINSNNKNSILYKKRLSAKQETNDERPPIPKASNSSSARKSLAMQRQDNSMLPPLSPLRRAQSSGIEFGCGSSPELNLASPPLSYSDHSKQFLKRIHKSDLDVSNSTKRSFWNSASRSRDDVMKSADDEEELEPQTSSQRQLSSPIQSVFTNGRMIEESPSNTVPGTPNRSVSVSPPAFRTRTRSEHSANNTKRSFWNSASRSRDDITKSNDEEEGQEPQTLSQRQLSTPIRSNSRLIEESASNTISGTPNRTVSDSPTAFGTRTRSEHSTNSTKKSFWNVASRSRDEITKSNDEEEGQEPQTSSQSQLDTPIRSVFSNSRLIDESPCNTIIGTTDRNISVSPIGFGTRTRSEHSGCELLPKKVRKSLLPLPRRSVSPSPIFSNQQSTSNLECTVPNKEIVDTTEGVSLERFLNRSNESSSKASLVYPSTWNDIPVVNPNSQCRDVVSTPIPRTPTPATNPYAGLYPDYADDDDYYEDDDDDSTVEGEKTILTRTIDLVKSFSFTRSVSRLVVDDQLLPPSLSIASTYDTRPVTEECVNTVYDDDRSYTPDEFIEVAEIGNAVAIVESEIQQTPKRSNTSWDSRVTVVRSEDLQSKQRKHSSAKSNGNENRVILEDVRHFQWFSHGTVFTIVALMFAILGVFFSLLSRRSTAFVELTTPLMISPLYTDINHVGMIWFNLCFNTTVSELIDDHTECTTVRLEVNDVGDRIFQMSRAFLSLGCVFGTFLSIFLCTSVYWESINLKPIGLGYLMTYFFQSFSLLFFDTNLCHVNGCQVSSGGIFCIIASFCWLFTCIATAKMDAHKMKQRRRRRRQIRREYRFRRQVQILADKILEEKSKHTENTTSDAGSVSDHLRQLQE